MHPVVVLPTRNEAGNIGAILRQLRDPSVAADVVVVDDDSSDGTADLAEAVAGELGGVSVIRRAGRRGLGSAYREGFARALIDGYETVISMDADRSHDPLVIPTMLALIADGADVVIGSRYVAGGGTAGWPVRRRLLSRWGNAYARTALGLPIADCTSGFRAYRAEVLGAIEPASTEAEGYAFLIELSRRAVDVGAEIVETPITFRDRVHGSSKMSLPIIVESMVRVTRWAMVARRDRRASAR